MKKRDGLNKFISVVIGLCLMLSLCSIFKSPESFPKVEAATSQTVDNASAFKNYVDNGNKYQYVYFGMYPQETFKNVQYSSNTINGLKAWIKELNESYYNKIKSNKNHPYYEYAKDYTTWEESTVRTFYPMEDYENGHISFDYRSGYYTVKEWCWSCSPGTILHTYNSTYDYYSKRFGKVENGKATTNLDHKIKDDFEYRTNASSAYGETQTINPGTIEIFKVKPIKWRILNVGNSMLLMSENILDATFQQNFSVYGTEWTRSSIRMWLNHGALTLDYKNDLYNNRTFITKAFSSGEQDMLVTRRISQEGHKSYYEGRWHYYTSEAIQESGASGKVEDRPYSYDKVFLVSMGEEDYHVSNKNGLNIADNLKAMDTEYSYACGNTINEEPDDWWKSRYYTRTSLVLGYNGYSKVNTMRSISGGSYWPGGQDFETVNTTFGVRPMISLDMRKVLNSTIQISSDEFEIYSENRNERYSADNSDSVTDEGLVYQDIKTVSTVNKVDFSNLESTHGSYTILQNKTLSGDNDLPYLHQLKIRWRGLTPNSRIFFKVRDNRDGNIIASAYYDIGNAVASEMPYNFKKADSNTNYSVELFVLKNKKLYEWEICQTGGVPSNIKSDTIYLDILGLYNGDDSQNGTSAMTPIKSFDLAKQRIADNGTLVIMSGQIEVTSGGEFTIGQAKNVRVKRYFKSISDYNGASIFNVNIQTSPNMVTFKNFYIDESQGDYNETEADAVKNNLDLKPNYLINVIKGQLILDKTFSVKNCKRGNAGGIISVSDKGFLTINGGELKFEMDSGKNPMNLEDIAIYSKNNISHSFIISNGNVRFNGGLFNANDNIRGNGGIVNITGNGTLDIFNTGFLSCTTNYGKGGVFYTEVPLRAKNSWFHYNRSVHDNYEEGGVIYAKNSLDIDMCDFYRNEIFTSGGDGGAIHSESKTHKAVIKNSYFNDSYSRSQGGAIYILGDLEVSNTKFIDNTSQFGGAAINSSGKLTVLDCYFENSSAKGAEYGRFYSSNIECRNEQTSLIVKNSTFLHNNWLDQWAVSGGAIGSLRKSNVIENCKFIGNNIFGNGGAVYLRNTQGINSITGCDFIDNYTWYKLKNKESTEDGESVIIKEVVGGKGGALYVESSETTITNCLFRGNGIDESNEVRSTCGGAIYSIGKLNLINCDIKSNMVATPRDEKDAFVGDHAKAGGVYSIGDLTVVRTRFYANQSPSTAALYNEGFVSITNSEFRDNYCETVRDSAGKTQHSTCGAFYLKLTNGASAIMKDTLIINNDAYGSGAGWISDDYGGERNSILIENCIVERNDATGASYAGITVNAEDVKIYNTNFIGNYTGGYCASLYVNAHGNNLIHIKGCQFKENKSGSYHSGAIESVSPLMVEDCVFEDNSNYREGSAIYCTSDLTCVNTTFLRNGIRGDEICATNGGAIYTTADLSLKGCVFDGNKANENGGAVFHGGEYLAVEDCVFKNNMTLLGKTSTYGYGAGIYTNKTLNMALIRNNKFIDNSSYRMSGGGILFNSYINKALLEGNLFTGNRANSGHGGAIAFYGTSNNIVMRENRFIDNSVSALGGAICFLSGAENISLINEYYEANYQYRTDQQIDGGALLFWGPTTCNIKNCSFIGNYATRGGAFSSTVSGAEITCENCYFEDNGVKKVVAEGGDPEKPERQVKTFKGGAIYMAGTLSLKNCRFVGNEAKEEAGAVYIGVKGVLENCDFISNKADLNGGGVYFYGNTENGGLDIKGCLFEKNTSGQNGGAISTQENKTWSSRQYCKDTKFIKNKSINGAALRSNRQIDLFNCIFDGNEGNSITYDNNLWINCLFINNKADYILYGYYFYLINTKIQYNVCGNRVINFNSRLISKGLEVSHNVMTNDTEIKAVMEFSDQGKRNDFKLDGAIFYDNKFNAKLDPDTGLPIKLDNGDLDGGSDVIDIYFSSDLPIAEENVNNRIIINNFSNKKALTFLVKEQNQLAGTIPFAIINSYYYDGTDKNYYDYQGSDNVKGLKYANPNYEIYLVEENKLYLKKVNGEGSKADDFVISDYIGVYDGFEHTVDYKLYGAAEMKFSLDGVEYNLTTPPKFRKPGKHVVYYSCAGEVGTRNIIIKDYSCEFDFSDISLGKMRYGDSIKVGEEATQFITGSVKDKMGNAVQGKFYRMPPETDLNNHFINEDWTLYFFPTSSIYGDNKGKGYACYPVAFVMYDSLYFYNGKFYPMAPDNKGEEDERYGIPIQKFKFSEVITHIRPGGSLYLYDELIVSSGEVATINQQINIYRGDSSVYGGDAWKSKSFIKILSGGTLNIGSKMMKEKINFIGLGNQAIIGAPIIINEGTLNIYGNIYFKDNYNTLESASKYKGGAIYNNGNAIIDADLGDIKIDNSRCDVDGGAIYNKKNLTLRNISITNSLGFSGGAIYSESGKLLIFNPYFSDNHSYARDKNGVRAKGNTISINSGTFEIYGGVIKNSSHYTTKIVWADSSGLSGAFKDGHSGGGIYIGENAKAHINSTSFENCVSYAGGAVFVAGTADIYLLNIRKCYTAKGGAGVYVMGGSTCNIGGLSNSNNGYLSIGSNPSDDILDVKPESEQDTVTSTTEKEVVATISEKVFEFKYVPFVVSMIGLLCCFGFVGAVLENNMILRKKRK